MAKGVKGFQKGNEGRKPGSENKISKDTKEAFKQLVESNIDNMTIWVSNIAETDPHKAMTLMLSMAEYFIPKLARVDNLQLPENTTPLTKIEIVDSTKS
jgi:hypothetical protein